MEGVPQAIPQEFEAKEKILHSKLEMKLKNKENHEFGTISEKVDELGTKFELYDEKGNLMATAHKIINSPDTSLQVKDPSQHKLGVLSHKMTKQALDLRDHLCVLDSQNKEQGKTDQMDIIEQAALFKDKEGIEIGEVKRDKSLLGDKWECRFIGNIDRRVLVFVAPFLSVLQGEKKEKLKEIQKEQKK